MILDLGYKITMYNGKSCSCFAATELKLIETKKTLVGKKEIRSQRRKHWLVKKGIRSQTPYRWANATVYNHAGDSNPESSDRLLR